MTERATQCERITQLLLDADGEWVSVLRLSEISLSHTRRIFELRKLFNIERKEELVDGKRHVWYRIPVHRSDGQKLLADFLANQEQPELFSCNGAGDVK